MDLDLAKTHYFDKTDMLGSVIEAEAFSGGEKLGRFVGVVKDVQKEDSMKILEVQICGCSDKDLWDTVQKKKWGSS